MIAESPTAVGRADYASFMELQVVAVVETKRQSMDVAEGVLNQAKRYSGDYEIKGEETFPAVLGESLRFRLCLRRMDDRFYGSCEPKAGSDSAICAVPTICVSLCLLGTTHKG